jgi:hypothetical protein
MKHGRPSKKAREGEEKEGTINGEVEAGDAAAAVEAAVGEAPAGAAAIEVEAAEEAAK